MGILTEKPIKGLTGRQVRTLAAQLEADARRMAHQRGEPKTHAARAADARVALDYLRMALNAAQDPLDADATDRLYAGLRLAFAALHESRFGRDPFTQEKAPESYRREADA